MKTLLALLAALGLTACDPSANEVSVPVLPEGMKDCKMFNIDTGMSSYIVFRCPGATTTTRYRSGKYSRTTVVVDGETYVKESKE